MTVTMTRPSATVKRDVLPDAYLVECSWGLKLVLNPGNPTPIVLLTPCCGGVFHGGGSNPAYRPRCARCSEEAPEWVAGQDGFLTRREFAERVEAWLEGTGLNPLDTVVVAPGLVEFIEEVYSAAQRELGELREERDARMETWLLTHSQVEL